jgi:hypothetical protein
MVKGKHKINIRDIFLGLQKQMRAKLSLNKKILTHPVAKGDASECEWINMLTSYLPSRYCADRAFVIDCEGNVSDQIDIVIYDRHYSPFILKQGGSTYIPAESVYAVIEVKPTLNMRNVEYASKKANSVRRLKRTTATIVHAGGRIEKPKKPFFILAGILTIDGYLSDKLKNNLDKAKKDNFLNFGCSLQDGAFWFKKCRGNKYSFERTAKKEESLIFFFLNLLSELQQLGTVPAIDLKAYIKSFKRK